MKKRIKELEDTIAMCKHGIDYYNDSIKGAVKGRYHTVKLMQQAAKELEDLKLEMNRPIIKKASES